MFCHSWFELLLQSWMRARICSNVCWKMKDPSKITAFLDVSAHWSMLIGRNSTGWLLKRNYRLLRLELPHVATKKYSVSCHLYFHSSSKAHAGPANFWTAQSSSAAGQSCLENHWKPTIQRGVQSLDADGCAKPWEDSHCAQQRRASGLSGNKLWPALAESAPKSHGLAKNWGESSSSRPGWSSQWIGLRENLQETQVLTPKYRGFLKNFPSTNSWKLGNDMLKDFLLRLANLWVYGSGMGSSEWYTANTLTLPSELHGGFLAWALPIALRFGSLEQSSIAHIPRIGLLVFKRVMLLLSSIRMC